MSTNQLISGGTITQGTTLGVEFGNQLVTGTSKQATSQACIVDLTPPVFSGVSAASVGSLGQIIVQWAAATDSTPPIYYEVYVKAANSSNLFNQIYIAGITTQLQTSVFNDSFGNLLQPATQYFIGVRAVDGVGNRDSNAVIVSQTSPGVTGAVNATISGIFNINESNQLIATFWATDNSGVIDSAVRLGPASYLLYDKNGNIVPSMAQTNILPDAEGFYEITPVDSVLDLDNNFYAARVTIQIDGSPLTNNLPVVASYISLLYEARAVFSINYHNELQGTLWVIKNGIQLTQNLGTASFTIRNKNGVSIGVSETGLVADANGLYQITSVPATLIQDLTHYTVDLEIVAEGQVRKGVVGLTLGE